MKSRRILTCVALALALSFTMSACKPKTTTPTPSPRVSAAQQGQRIVLTPSPSASASDAAKQVDVEAIRARLTDKLGNFDGEPTLKVYVVEDSAVQDMQVEDYLQGVLAGEMKNDWPMEALKAQAILARTFALEFVLKKTSEYTGAQVSTDIKEAQAYDASGINDRIKQAIEETRGLVLTYDNDLIFSWFHAHAGGMTALAKEGINYKDPEPPYLKIVESPDSKKAPAEDAQWEATFTADEVIAAAQNAQGVTLDGLSSVEIGQRGESGRAITLVINGQEVNAPDFRVAIDSMRMKSTLLTNARVQDGKLYLAGKGYGHGVGMSQWGAYAMAEEGKSCEEIVTYYFNDVVIADLW